LPTGLETAQLQANVNSPIANQQWMDNGARQVVPLASPEFGCGQNMPYSTKMPAIDSALSPNMDYLMMMVQQSMLNGVESGRGRQTSADRVVRQPQFGGKQPYVEPSLHV